MSEPVTIGVDAGATKILIGVVTQRGEILLSRRYRMDSQSQESTLQSILASLENFLKHWNGPRPQAIGLGLVGLTDPQTGTWLEAMNLPIRTPIRLAQEIGYRYGLPVSLDNDVHAATRAELRWGIGTACEDFIYLNIGTGAGAGLVTGGRLVRGAGNYAGELGHMIVRTDRPPCVCGRRGCLEPIASGGGILARARDEAQNYPDSLLTSFGDSLTTHQVFTAADSGDPLAIRISTEAVNALSTALTNLVNLLNPEWIVYGGGTLSDGWLMSHVSEDLESKLLPVIRKSLKGIVPSKLNMDQVGLLGAACLAMRDGETT